MRPISLAEFRNLRYTRQVVKQASIPGFLPTEHWEQVALFQHFDREVRSGRNPWLEAAFAIPNGARTSMGTAVKLKMEGLKGGMHDVLIPVGRRGYVGLTLEMKRKKGGKVSRRQNWWAGVLASQGWLTFAPPGWEVARDLVDWYFGLGRWPYPQGYEYNPPEPPPGKHNTASGPLLLPGWPEYPDAD